MNRSDVKEIIAELVDNYPNFDGSDENIDRHHKYLRDFPFDAAMKNVIEHIKTNKFPPLIADIRGRLGDQMDSQRSKELAASYFAQLEASRLCNVPPPEGYWEHTRRLIRGEAT